MQMDGYKTRCLWTLIATAALLLVLLAQPALGVPITKQWVGTPFNNLWTTASNWSPSGEPGAGDDVFVTQSGFFPETVIYNTLANPTLYSLTVDATGWGNITLQQSGNALTADNETVGLDGRGVYDQSGGSNTVNSNLYLGYNPTGKGTYYLKGGSLQVDGNEYIGYYGTGIVTQSGGTHTIATLEIAPGATPSGSTLYPSKGTYNLTGGSLSVSNEEVIGVIGTGVFTQSGGTNTTPSLRLGDNLVTYQSNTYQGNGTYNLCRGSLSVSGDEVIGSYGIGNFNQSGGTHTVGLDLTLGNEFTEVTGKGTYNLAKGGSLTVDGDEYVGRSGTGSFSQFGGTNTTRYLVIGANIAIIPSTAYISYGTYNLTGGSLLVSAGEIIGGNGTGFFTQSGGTNMTPYLKLGDTFTSLGSSYYFANGTYNLKGGSFSVGEETIGLQGIGVFNQSGGTHQISNDLNLGYESTGKGTYNLSCTGSLSVSGDEFIGYKGTGVFTQFGGSHTVKNDLHLGDQSTGNGTYHLYGGSLQVDGSEFPGFQGTGFFDQCSGQHTVTGFFALGLADNSIGTYHLKGGSLQVGGNEVIGLGGTGVFEQSGGQHTIASAPGLLLGANGGSSGTYNLKSGTLAVGDDETVGTFGTGVFDQSGGKNMVAGNLTLGAGDTIHGRGSGTYNLKCGTLAVGTDEIVGKFGTGVFDQTGGTHTVAGTLTLADQPGSSGTYNLNRGTLKANDEMIGPVGTGVFNQNGGANIVTNSLTLSPLGGTGTYNLNGGILSAKTIDIDANDTFNVKNTITTVTGDVTNNGTVKTTNACVTWNGNFINNGAYISDPATQTFTDLMVPDNFTAYLKGASQDLFVVKGDFINQATNYIDWNTAAATLQFVKGADKSHNFYIPGEDYGPSGTNAWAWGTLNIFGQTVHLFDGNYDSGGGAQYVGGLIGAQVNWLTKKVYNIFNDDPSGTTLNIYYDPDLLINAYLLGKTYDFAGGLGQLIPDPPNAAPLPPSVLLLGSGLLGLGLLGWRRKHMKG